ncbi:MAG: DeoR/GlpR family DNA-binding transcription regulator [Acutalibacteraceae bacterium]
MLSEERYAAIIDFLSIRKAATVTELAEMLDTSESTIRRDLNALGEMGKLNKVHGGATAIENRIDSVDEDFEVKALKNVEEKKAIARYAASLVNDNDIVFIDAGTTTQMLIDYLDTNLRTVFVTNGIVHAKKLIQKGFKAYIIGGQLKLATQAVIGAEAINSLGKYNFTKCFLGANGVSVDSGFTTPDLEEALVKKEAANRSYMDYVLADHSKFKLVSAITFLELSRACVITDKLTDNKFREFTVIKEVSI